MNPQRGEAFNVGVLIGACAVGVIFGLVPLIVGIIRKRPVLGIAGFVTTAFGGFILGMLLAIPSAAVWTIILAAIPAGDAAEKQRRRMRRDHYDDDDYEGDYEEYDRHYDKYTDRGRPRRSSRSRGDYPDDETGEVDDRFRRDD